MFGEKPESEGDEGESPDVKKKEEEGEEEHGPLNTEQKMRLTLNYKR